MVFARRPGDLRARPRLRAGHGAPAAWPRPRGGTSTATAPSWPGAPCSPPPSRTPRHSEGIVGLWDAEDGLPPHGRGAHGRHRPARPQAPARRAACSSPTAASPPTPPTGPSSTSPPCARTSPLLDPLGDGVAGDRGARPRRSTRLSIRHLALRAGRHRRLRHAVGGRPGGARAPPRPARPGRRRSRWPRRPRPRRG